VLAEWVGQTKDKGEFMYKHSYFHVFLEAICSSLFNSGSDGFR